MTPLTRAVMAHTGKASEKDRFDVTRALLAAGATTGSVVSGGPHEVCLRKLSPSQYTYRSHDINTLYRVRRRQFIAFSRVFYLSPRLPPQGRTAYDLAVAFHSLRVAEMLKAVNEQVVRGVQRDLTQFSSFSPAIVRAGAGLL
jgi:hypothetical protein